MWIVPQDLVNINAWKTMFDPYIELWYFKGVYLKGGDFLI